MNRDDLKHKLDEGRDRAESALRSWRALEQQKRTFILRMASLSAVLAVLLIVGASFIWRPFASGGGDYQRARTASAASRSLAADIRARIEGEPNLQNVTVTPVATTTEADEYLMVYGRVPSQQAMSQLRTAVEAAAPGRRIEWRITIQPPADAPDPTG